MSDRHGRQPRWRTSSASASDNCVEVAVVAAGVLVRDSKAPDGAVLLFTPRAWAIFVHHLKTADLDR